MKKKKTIKIKKVDNIFSVAMLGKAPKGMTALKARE